MADECSFISMFFIHIKMTLPKFLNLYTTYMHGPVRSDPPIRPILREHDAFIQSTDVIGVNDEESHQLVLHTDVLLTGMDQKTLDETHNCEYSFKTHTDFLKALHKIERIQLDWVICIVSYIQKLVPCNFPLEEGSLVTLQESLFWTM